MLAPSDTRQRILAAALKRFARQGYAGTSVQDIVTAARVSKPALYYHFRDKAALYQALVAQAGDERLRLMREAVARAETLSGQLQELCAAVFDFTRSHRELMRLAFATAVAAPGEVPREAHCFERGWESFQFIQELLERGLEAGALDRRFDSRALALGFGGLIHLRVLLHLAQPDQPLDRQAAKEVVDLFLSGSATGAREESSDVDSAVGRTAARPTHRQARIPA